MVQVGLSSSCLLEPQLLRFISLWRLQHLKLQRNSGGSRRGSPGLDRNLWRRKNLGGGLKSAVQDPRINSPSLSLLLSVKMEVALWTQKAPLPLRMVSAFIGFFCVFVRLIYLELSSYLYISLHLFFLLKSKLLSHVFEGQVWENAIQSNPEEFSQRKRHSLRKNPSSEIQRFQDISKMTSRIKTKK